jgi:aspartate kinase
MQVYKFGGASVKDAEGIKNLAKILTLSSSKNILVVISAMGKTTNALEEITLGYFHQDEKFHQLFEEVKHYHFNIIGELFGGQAPAAVLDDINNAFVEIEWMIEDDPQDEYDYIYDQIVSVGELISTKIVSHYLNHTGVSNQWIDARSYIQTDNTYREANVNWDKTCSLITKDLPQVLDDKFIITQGFIGNTSENFTTTLGREGSDYSAAIFANCIDAESLTVWKDVPGILNADPKLFTDTLKFDELSYAEAIEMTFYGATVIHPKTIKPLQNKHIPLYVKPFMAPEEAGTVIKSGEVAIKTPIIIIKNKQLLLSLNTKDFSFITEEHLFNIFKIFSERSIKMNMMQVSALSFSVCFDHDDAKFNQLKELIEEEFVFRYNTNLSLMTIRHANEEHIHKYVAADKVVLEQRSRNTAQFVLQN